MLIDPVHDDLEIVEETTTLHGGAWKVAYADFVTAMMALFIVLWLVNASEETKAAVEAYFNNPSFFPGKGRGFLTDDGAAQLQERLIQIQESREAVSSAGGPARGVNSDMIEMEREYLMSSANEMQELLKQSPVLQDFEGQVSMEMTSEGLRVQIHDQELQPLFDSGSNELSAKSRELLKSIAGILSKLPNPVVVEGHTDSRPFTSAEGDRTNWELSGQRANTARRVLEEYGVDPTRISRVVGYADRRPLDPHKPFSPRNRRISIIVRYQNDVEMNQ